MGFFSGVEFWILLTILSIPMIFLGIKEKNNRNYLLIVSVIFVFLIYLKDYKSFISLISFLIYNYFLVYYCLLKKR